MVAVGVRVGTPSPDSESRLRVPTLTPTLTGNDRIPNDAVPPVGKAELDLIANSGFARFPPRLPGQPIFYPVLTESYATEIARDWNTRDRASGYAGYVLRFQVDSEFLERYPIQIAGASRHRELWVPAEEMEEFNRHIRGAIEVIAEFHTLGSESGL